MKLLKKIDLWMVALFIAVGALTWIVAELVTPGFTTEEYLSGFHINHSFVGLFVVFIAFIGKNTKYIPRNMFVILLALGTTLIVHDGVIFQELGVLP